MKKVILTTHWSGGDVFPFIRIGKALKDRGLDVVLFTHCKYNKIVNDTGIKFISWDTSDEWEKIINRLKTQTDNDNFFKNMLEFRKDCHNRFNFLNEFQKIKSECTEDSIIITRYISGLSAIAAAESLRIPLVNVILAPSYIFQPEMEMNLYGHFLTEDINSFRADIGLNPVDTWMDMVNASKVHLGLWPNWFTCKESKIPLDVQAIGFTLNEEAEMSSLPEGLEHDLYTKDYILVTGGTSDVLDPIFYKICLEAISKLRLPAIFVCKEPVDFAQNNSNIKWYPFLPFGRVMPHVKAIIHHGGIGTLSRAIASGIPQIILPHRYDRPYNAFILEKLNLSKTIKPLDWNADSLVKALNSLECEPMKDSCKRYSQLINCENTIQQICSIVEDSYNNSKLIPESANMKSMCIQKNRNDNGLLSASLKNIDSKKRELLIAKILSKNKNSGVSDCK